MKVNWSRMILGIAEEQKLSPVEKQVNSSRSKNKPFIKPNVIEEKVLFDRSKNKE
jgi:hypothetical protein